MSGDALFATAPYDEGAGCACCGSREHATNGCPTGVAADLWTAHEETHEGPRCAVLGCDEPYGCAAHPFDGAGFAAWSERHAVDNGPDAVAARRAMFAGFGWTR